MYVAVESLQLKDRVARPGDPVPEAETWTAPVLKTHLEWGKIRWVDKKATGLEIDSPGDKTSTKPKKHASKKRRV